MPCSCCAGESLDIFGEKGARRALRRYLRRGLRDPDATTIVAWAEEGGLESQTVLEVGGGIGQVQAELLRRGAAHGIVLEVVAAYEAPAREIAAAVGVADRSSFVLGDLLEAPDVVAPADVVVMRRVVCCSPEGPRLLEAAGRDARRTLIASYPRDRLAVRAVAWLQNAGLALARKRFRVFVHAPATLERAAAAAGLRLARVSRGAVWETAEFEVAEPVRAS